MAHFSTTGEFALSRFEAACHTCDANPVQADDVANTLAAADVRYHTVGETEET